MKTILITGANGGLGSELAEYLLDKGEYVILQYRTHHNKVDALHEKYPKTSMLLKGDVSDELIVRHMLAECAGLPIDVLVNNAAIDHVCEVKDKTSDTFMKVFKVNTLGPFLMCQYFGEVIDKNHGHIINISSDNSVDKYDPITMEYDVSKIGLNMLTYDFAKYYKYAKVNALAFGWLDTGMDVIDECTKKLLVYVPIPKAIDEIVNMMNVDYTGRIKVIDK